MARNQTPEAARGARDDQDTRRDGRDDHGRARAAPPPVPPHDLDAEGVVLSACLERDDARAEALRLLRPFMFYSEPNRQIFSAIAKLDGAGKSIDPVTVAAQLREDDRLGQVGGSAYLLQLIETIPFYIHTAEHCSIVANLWRVRNVIASCQRLQAEGYRAPADPASWVAGARDEMAQLADGAGGVGALQLLEGSRLFAPLEPVSWLVDRTIARGTVVLVGGYGASGKTWMAADLAVAVASGKKWLGRFEVDAPGPVVILDYESGEYELRRRLRAVAGGLGIREDEDLPIRAAIMPNLYFTSPDFEREVARLAQTARLIVIDSLAAASPGIDENSAEMRTGLDRLRRVAEMTDCVFVVLVHAKKTSGSPSRIDDREVFRGSSAIFDAADTALAVFWKEGDPLRLKCTKARCGKKWPPVDVTIADCMTGVLVQATDPDAAGGDQGDDRQRAVLRRQDKVGDRICQVVYNSSGLTIRQLRASLPAGLVGTNAFQAAVDRLLVSGRLQETPGPRGARCLSVGTWRPVQATATATEDPEG